MKEKSWVQKQVRIVLYECDKIWSYLKDDEEKDQFLDELYDEIANWVADKSAEIDYD